jgi:hypothetical protein
MGGRAVILAALASGLLTGCSKPAGQVEACRVPTLVPHAPPETYAGAHERATICIKLAAYAIAKGGGPVNAIGPAALAQCAAEQRAVVVALGREGPVWPYQQTRLNEDFAHLANLTATQARAIGCGGPSGTLSDDN